MKPGPHWRRDRTVDPALRALVLTYEYEDWPRGRIVCVSVGPFRGRFTSSLGMLAL